MNNQGMLTVSQGQIAHDAVASIEVGRQLNLDYSGVEFVTNYQLSEDSSEVVGSDKLVPFWKLSTTSTLDEDTGNILLQLERKSEGTLPIRQGQKLHTWLIAFETLSDLDQSINKLEYGEIDLEWASSKIEPPL